jgi:hypothetical protein
MQADGKFAVSVAFGCGKRKKSMVQIHPEPFMPTYSVDVWGTGPKPENFQNIEAENEEEAKQKGRDLSNARTITNIEASEMTIRR